VKQIRRRVRSKAGDMHLPDAFVFASNAAQCFALIDVQHSK
jgi:hypothetical protein